MQKFVSGKSVKIGKDNFSLEMHFITPSKKDGPNLKHYFQRFLQIRENTQKSNDKVHSNSDLVSQIKFTTFRNHLSHCWLVNTNLFYFLCLLFLNLVLMQPWLDSCAPSILTKSSRSILIFLLMRELLLSVMKMLF